MARSGARVAILPGGKHRSDQMKEPSVRPAVRRPKAKRIAEEDADILVFDAQKLALALAFHLAEEDAPPHMTPRRIAAMYARLRRRSARVSVERRAWAALTNAERLEILLEAAGEERLGV